MLNAKSSVSFSESVERTAHENGLSLIETLTWFMERDNLEAEHLTKLLTSDLKSKLEIEASGLFLLKRKDTTERLPI